jgi:hypothetical protein
MLKLKGKSSCRMLEARINVIDKSVDEDIFEGQENG